MQTMTLLRSFRRGNSWVALKPLCMRRLSAIKRAMGYTTHLSNSLSSLFQVYIKCNYYYAVAICYTKMLLCGSHRFDRANKLYLNLCHLYGFEGIDKLDRKKLVLSFDINKEKIHYNLLYYKKDDRIYMYNILHIYQCITAKGFP